MWGLLTGAFGCPGAAQSGDPERPLPWLPQGLDHTCYLAPGGPRLPCPQGALTGSRCASRGQPQGPCGQEVRRDWAVPGLGFFPVLHQCWGQRPTSHIPTPPRSTPGTLLLPEPPASGPSHLLCLLPAHSPPAPWAPSTGLTPLGTTGGWSRPVLESWVPLDHSEHVRGL